jgi:hypothetical protein
LRIDVKTGKQRTNIQNACLHLYCTHVSEALNDAGISFTQFFKNGYEVPWSMEIVKDQMWRPIQKAITDKESTTEPLTNQYPKIYDYLNLKLGEHGIHVPWPSKETLEAQNGNNS